MNEIPIKGIKGRMTNTIFFNINHLSGATTLSNRYNLRAKIKVLTIIAQHPGHGFSNIRIFDIFLMLGDQICHSIIVYDASTTEGREAY